MSYILRFTVKKEDIVEEVNKTIAYVGAKTLAQSGGNEFGHIHLDEHTDEMLTRFWQEANKSVLGVGKQFVRYYGEVVYSSVATEEGANDVADGDTLNGTYTKIELNTENTVTFKYEFRDDHNPAMDAGIERMCNSYIVWYVAARWLEVCGMASEAQSYMATAASFLKTLESMLYSTLHTRAEEGGISDSNQLGDIVDSQSGDGTSGEEETTSNQLGDIVDSQSGDGTSGEEETTSNQLGDIVDSQSGDGGSGEEEADTNIGFTFPQGWGTIKVERYTMSRRRGTDER